MNLDRLVIGANASALRENQHILAALQGMLSRAQGRHISLTAIDGDAAREGESPADDAGLVEFRLENRADAATGRPLARNDGQNLGHRSVIANDDDAVGAAGMHLLGVLEVPAPHDFGECPENSHDNGIDRALMQRKRRHGAVVMRSRITRSRDLPGHATSSRR